MIKINSEKVDKYLNTKYVVEDNIYKVKTTKRFFPNLLYYNPLIQIGDAYYEIIVCINRTPWGSYLNNNNKDQIYSVYKTTTGTYQTENDQGVKLGCLDNVLRKTSSGKSYTYTGLRQQEIGLNFFDFTLKLYFNDIITSGHPIQINVFKIEADEIDKVSPVEFLRKNAINMIEFGRSYFISTPEVIYLENCQIYNNKNKIKKVKLTKSYYDNYDKLIEEFGAI